MAGSKRTRTPSKRKQAKPSPATTMSQQSSNTAVNAAPALESPSLEPPSKSGFHSNKALSKGKSSGQETATAMLQQPNDAAMTVPPTLEFFMKSNSDTDKTPSKGKSFRQGTATTMSRQPENAAVTSLSTLGFFTKSLTKKRKFTELKEDEAGSGNSKVMRRMCECCKELRDEDALVNEPSRTGLYLQEPVCVDCHDRATTMRERLDMSMASDCSICAETKFSEFPVTSHQVGQKHDHDVCLSCLRTQLQQGLDNKTTGQITCLQCNIVLSEPDIKEIASEDQYQQYAEKASMEFLRQDPSFRECPSSNCSYGYIHTTRENGNIFRCELCQARYCIVCEVQMHEDETCEAYQTRMKKTQQDTTATNRYLKVETKECPNCKVRVSKDGGCDHMTCKACQFQFCWQCRAPYHGTIGIFNVGNSAHAENCRYHTTNLAAPLPDAPPEAGNGSDSGNDSDTSSDDSDPSNDSASDDDLDPVILRVRNRPEPEEPEPEPEEPGTEEPEPDYALDQEDEDLVGMTRTSNDTGTLGSARVEQETESGGRVVLRRSRRLNN